MGRLAIVTEHDSFSVNINWRHEPNNELIEMAGPLGQGKVSFAVTDNQVLVDDGKNIRVYQGTVDQLVLRRFAVKIPVHALRYWLLGLVEPGVDYKERDSGFEQHGWQVMYRQLQAVGSDWLPRKINMEKDRDKIKLIVDQWEIS